MLCQSAWPAEHLVACGLNMSRGALHTASWHAPILDT
jgi:hypothetical protein